ncbi:MULTISPECIES: hypothetical protein [unclassified Shinella]|uniref:hypothetical protein n=1 Tax=unclassified Shinella TaxID=2643062 RepID=UPI00234EF014|nr:MULTISPECIES: hypothetical protein [unclassified Shinella]MCO5153349.1 hypothetical protein [Shinella sp.]MDC7260528.1 hypothetical protein [Shinella sp. HY16]MDC7267423.1 hypothetical protein [Shinella sp. YZ44]
MARTTVDRYLKNKAFDHIDHALGRPVDPLVESHRNYFATDKDSGIAKGFAASPFWALNGIRDDMAFYRVTPAGREALVKHLKEIGDKHRLYDVTYQGQTQSIVAISASKAKYRIWLDISDCFCDLTFGAFTRQASVRLAATTSKSSGVSQND